MKKRNIFFFLLLWTTSVFAEPASLLLQKKLISIQSMRAEFVQKVYAKSREISASSGEMALKRPGLFLWKTEKPMSQKIIADGKQLWVYDVDLEQVTVSPQQKKIGPTAALFLSDRELEIARDFEVQLQQAFNKQIVFDLKSKSARANIRRMILHFTQNQLTQMTFYDQLGQRTDVLFKHIVMNQTLPVHFFQFKPPKGVDVVKQEAGAS